MNFTVDCDTAILTNNLITPLALIASELIQNAIDHAECTEVAITLRTHPDAVILTVGDNGRGFPPAEDMRDDGKSSQGLGMTIVRTIAESELGGSLDLEDNEPGALVRVRVPLFDER